MPVEPASAAERYGSEHRPIDAAALPQSPTVVCTLGMHRSGTSLVSRILNLLGVYLGAPDDVSRSGADNPKGYWEHYPIALLNEEILTRFGGRWHEPPAFPPSWPLDPRVADLREQARVLLAETFSAAPLWGWKDPRTCLTLPFWQDAIGSIRYVICIRNPGAVLASLRRRDGMSPEQAERLWLTHVQSSLAHTSTQPRLFVCYDDIMHDWAPQVRRLAAFIGRPQQAEDPHVLKEIGAFLEQELYHHRTTTEDLAADPQISFVTTGLYLALKSHATEGAPADDGGAANGASHNRERALDLLAAQALATWTAHAALTSEHQRFLHDHQAQTALSDVLSTERDRLVGEVGALEERATRLAAECQEHTDRTAQLQQAVESVESRLDVVTHERDEEARAHNSVREELRSIHASRAWRLLSIVRRRLIRLLPPGTARHRVFSVLRQSAARQIQEESRTGSRIVR